MHALGAELAYHLITHAVADAPSPDGVRAALEGLVDLWPFADRARWPRDALFTRRLEQLADLNRRHGWILTAGEIDRELASRSR